MQDGERPQIRALRNLDPRPHNTTLHPCPYTLAYILFCVLISFSDVDKDLIARQTGGWSGADLSNLVNEAALAAAKEGWDLITPQQIDQVG